MCKKKYIKTEEHKLRCPACKGRVDYPADSTTFGTWSKALSMSPPGDLTQCDGCSVMLEYVSDKGSLRLRLAPRERVELFDKLTRESDPEPTLPELINYVRKFRHMPHRFHTR